MVKVPLEDLPGAKVEKEVLEVVPEKEAKEVQMEEDKLVVEKVQEVEVVPEKEVREAHMEEDKLLVEKVLLEEKV